MATTSANEVFVNYRRLQMKHGFGNRLSEGLKDRGITAILEGEEEDDADPRRHDLRTKTHELRVKAAGTATVLVAIFDQDYAKSHWCLDELAEAVGSCKPGFSEEDHVIIPIYHHGVKAEDLRNSKDGPVAKAMKAHLYADCITEHNEETISRWKDALSFASWLEGFRLEAYNGCEEALLEDLVTTIECFIRKERSLHITLFAPAQACFKDAAALAQAALGIQVVTCSNQCFLLRKSLIACLSSLSNYTVRDCPALHALVVALAKARDLLRSCDQANWLASAVLMEEGNEYFRDVVQDLRWFTDLMVEMATDGPRDVAAEQNQSAMATPFNVLKQRDRQRLIDQLLSSYADNTEPHAPYSRQHLIDQLLSSYADHTDRSLVRYLWLRLNTTDGVMVPDALCIDFNQLKIECALAAGTYGNVLKAKWLGQDCAVKLFPVEDSTFEKEVDALRRLEPHPNIVRMLGYTKKQNEAPCLVMELLKTDLGKLMDKGERFSILEKVEILVAVAKGMTYLHEKQIFHRDLKPHNVLLQLVVNNGVRYWRVKITDFGTSKTDYMTVQASAATTRIGTLAYMAPEVWTESDQYVSKYSKKADVYSFAMLGWHLLHGHVPHLHPKEAKIGERPDFLTTLPLPLRDLLRSCWQTVPEKRPFFAVILHDLLVIKKNMLLSNEGLTAGDNTATSNINDALNYGQYELDPVPSKAAEISSINLLRS